MTMNKYLVEISHYFRGDETFEVVAQNKAEALVKAKEYVKKSPLYGDNYKVDSVRIVKKLKPAN